MWRKECSGTALNSLEFHGLIVLLGFCVYFLFIYLYFCKVSFVKLLQLAGKRGWKQRTEWCSEMRPLQTCIVPRQNQCWVSGRWDGVLEEEKLLQVSAILLHWEQGEYLSSLPLSDMALKAIVLCTRLLQCRRAGAPLAPNALVVA